MIELSLALPECRVWLPFGVRSKPWAGSGALDSSVPVLGVHGVNEAFSIILNLDDARRYLDVRRK